MITMAPGALSFGNRCMRICYVFLFIMAFLAQFRNLRNWDKEFVVTCMWIVTVDTLPLSYRLMKIFTFYFFRVTAAAEFLPGADQLKGVFLRINQSVTEFTHTARHGFMNESFLTVRIMTFPGGTALCSFCGLLACPQAGQ
jgi:hypothetical protein